MTAAALIGAVGAMFAVIAGATPVIAAIAFARRADRWVADEFTIGYNLLADQIPPQNR